MELRKTHVLLAGIALLGLSACNPFGGQEQQQQADPNGKLALAGNGQPVAAAAPDFGDDASQFSKDGECDDMRFAGAGMTSTPLLDQDIKHDASDCRAAFEQNRLTFKGDNVTSASLASDTTAQIDRIQWGDDNGSFANDGECDDKRFQGAGMTSTPLLDQDIQHDATDCRNAFQQGRLALR
jgi:hypothetical protein